MPNRKKKKFTYRDAIVLFVLLIVLILAVGYILDVVVPSIFSSNAATTPTALNYDFPFVYTVNANLQEMRVYDPEGETWGWFTGFGSRSDCSTVVAVIRRIDRTEFSFCTHETFSTPNWRGEVTGVMIVGMTQTVSIQWTPLDN